MAQLVDFVVNGGILFDIGVRGRNIGLRLIVIIIGNKVFHGVIREKLLKLAVELGRQRFVVRNHQRGAVQRLYDVRHGEGFSRTRHAQKRLKLVSFPEAFHQRLDGLRLIAGGLKIRYQMKMIHAP